MNKLEKQILKEAVGEVSPTLALCSRTNIDTGRWWRKSRLWLVVMPEELIVLAAKRRQYLERVALSECGDTHYDHGTGMLVIGPTEDLEYSHVAMPVSDAVTILRLIGIEP